MSNRFDLLMRIPIGEKAIWRNIGSAFESRTNPGRYMLLLDAIPAPEDRQYKIYMVPPTPKEDRPQQQQQQPAQQPAQRAADNELPPGW